MSRVYVPATYGLLAEYLEARTVPTEGGIRAGDTTEEAEYDALIEAAVASAVLAGTGDRRRVVLAVDVTTPGLAAAWSDVAAAHVDIEPGADPDDDLAWYATQEIPDLLAP